MGNANEAPGQGGNKKQRKSFLEGVQKVSSGESSIWGDYSIYQQKHKPYDYFLEYIQLAHPQRDFLQKKLAFYQNMPKHKNLVAIQYAEIVKRKELCAQFEALRVFCMYYNFTLEDGIRVKIKQRSNFTEGELVYIIRSLLLIGRYYQTELKAKCYSGIFQSKEVFISPQGHLKIYPFNDNIFSTYLKLTHKLPKDIDQNGNGMAIKQETTYQCTKRTERRRGRIRTTLNIQNERVGNGVIQMQSQQLKWNNIGKQSQWLFMHQNTQSTSFTKRQSKLSLQESPLNSMRTFPQHSFRGKLQHQHQQPSYLSSLASTNKLTEREQVRGNGSCRDWFQLGILMMQLILLNDSQDYYYETGDVLTEKSEKYAGNYHQIGFNKTFNLGASLQQFGEGQNFTTSKHALRYQNKEGKKPNLDLIQFSLNNLLPKKNISQALIQIIALLLSPNQHNLTYGQLITTVEQHQQTLSEPKYCLKFDLQNQSEQTPQIDDEHFSREIVKNQSIDPFLKTTNLSSRAFINNESSLSSYNYENKFIIQSKQSFNVQNLDDLVNINNLTRSMVVEEGEDNIKSADILNGLKKSRKLVPTKIRSVSNKNSDIHQTNLSKSKNFV